MDPLNHLNFENFERPIVVRLIPEQGEKIITPTFSIQELLLNSGLPEKKIDIAQTVAPREPDEVAFDGKSVSSVENVTSKIEDMVEKYNEPPDKEYITEEDWPTIKIEFFEPK